MFNLGKYFLPPAKSTFAHNTDALFNFITNTGALLLLGIVVVMIYFVIKYRRRSDDDVTSLVDHNTTLEIVWTVIPLILVLVIFSWGFKGYYTLFTPPQDSYEINVTAQQWLWKFHYKNGKTTINKLYVPAGRDVKLIMTSKDVIHSLFIPDFRVKHDVLPDKYEELWFNAKKPGHANLFCTQYCGQGHSNMHADVIIESQKKFNAWLKKGANGSSGGNGKPQGMSQAAYGKQLYQKNGCSSCHSTDGSKGVGPSWKGIFGHKVTFKDGSSKTVDENYIRQSILNPGAKVVKGFNNVMPTFQGVLNSDQISAIIAYIKTLK
ncbi:MAG TPA: cytochrome c oxidase subunit II [Balneolales bacterium]|nr:cytochrome c oxidase subunit II [Balneolales bacterium]